MGRMYSAVFQGVAVTAAQDVISLLAPSDRAIKIHAIYIGQSSDAGDAQDELLRIRIRRGMTTVGSGGGTVTPVDYQNSGSASGVTARINDTTAASAGTITEVHEECFNVRAGWVFLPTPEMRPVCSISTRIAVNLPAAPADSLTMSGTIYFEELV
jgi:hypothetical protein